MNFANVMVVMVTDKLVPSIEATSLLLRYVISRRTVFILLKLYVIHLLVSDILHF